MRHYTPLWEGVVLIRINHSTFCINGSCHEICFVIACGLLGLPAGVWLAQKGQRSIWHMPREFNKQLHTLTHTQRLRLSSAERPIRQHDLEYCNPIATPLAHVSLCLYVCVSMYPCVCGCLYACCTCNILYTLNASCMFNCRQYQMRRQITCCSFIYTLHIALCGCVWVQIYIHIYIYI